MSAVEELNHKPVSFLQVWFDNRSSNHVYLSCDGVQSGVATGDTWSVSVNLPDTHASTLRLLVASKCGWLL
jgi:hypothetical protein